MTIANSNPHRTDSKTLPPAPPPPPARDIRGRTQPGTAPAALAATILQGAPRDPLPAATIWRRTLVALWAERRYQAALARRDRNERRCRALARARSRARVALACARGLL